MTLRYRFSFPIDAYGASETRGQPHVAGLWIAEDSPSFQRMAVGTMGPLQAEYVDRIRQYVQRVGRLEWAAQQDWMCEPWILAKTGLSVTTPSVDDRGKPRHAA
jgi:hypothetical protein